MRDYAKIAPTFWTGETGRQIRAKGPACQIVALYSLSSPHANMLGLYYLPIPFICHETGLREADVLASLAELDGLDFAKYDPLTEHIWVVEMATYQIAESLHRKDNQVIGIQKLFDSLPTNAFTQKFIDKYGDDFHLKSPRASEGPSQPPSQGPSKPGAGSGAGSGDRTGDGKDVGPSAKSAEAPSGFKFILGNKGPEGQDIYWDLPVAKLDEFKATYPALNIENILKVSALWLSNNPARRKTARGMPRFLGAWIERDQNRGGGNRQGFQRPQPIGGKEDKYGDRHI